MLFVRPSETRQKLYNLEWIYKSLSSARERNILPAAQWL